MQKAEFSFRDGKSNFLRFNPNKTDCTNQFQNKNSKIIGKIKYYMFIALKAKLINSREHRHLDWQNEMQKNQQNFIYLEWN